MAAFGLAQIMYTAAFGFKPLNATLGAALYTFGATGELYALISAHVDEITYITVSCRLTTLKQTVLLDFSDLFCKNWKNT
jgi:hypothetical protein